MQLPKAVGIELTYNDHALSYLSVEAALADPLEVDLEDFETEEEVQKAIATDSVWVCQWYPKTPVGFLKVAASTLEECVAYALRVEEQIKE